MKKIIFKSVGLSKNFNNKTALNNFSMTLYEGEIYGLVGKNGSGKTTLMNIICGLLKPSSGYFELWGESKGKTLVDKRKGIGSIIEMPALYENMTARENLSAQSILTGNRDKKHIENLLEIFDLAKDKNKKAEDFSLGMKQRLGLALTMVNKPSFLVLDEPINGLDPEGIINFRNMLKNLSKESKVTILISSHILSELEQIATRFGFIDEGVLVREFEFGFTNNNLEDFFLDLINTNENIPSNNEKLNLWRRQ